MMKIWDTIEYKKQKNLDLSFKKRLRQCIINKGTKAIKTDFTPASKGFGNRKRRIPKTIVVQTVLKFSIFTNIDGVRLHLGWVGDYMDVQPRVQSQMTPLIKSHPTASILFMDIVYATPAAFQGIVSGDWLSSLVPRNKIYIIIAGSPRIGDQSFVNAIR
jgi:hypothetical protein